MPALAKDLMGCSIPDQAATRIGWPGTSAITAAGSSATDATVLGKDARVVLMTATGADGVKLPSDAELMVPYIVYNSSGSTGKVYPPTSGTLNGGTATSGSLSLTTLKVAVFYRYSSVGWIFNLTA